MLVLTTTVNLRAMEDKEAEFYFIIFQSHRICSSTVTQSKCQGLLSIGILIHNRYLHSDLRFCLNAPMSKLSDLIVCQYSIFPSHLLPTPTLTVIINCSVSSPEVLIRHLSYYCAMSPKKHTSRFYFFLLCGWACFYKLIIPIL